TPFVKISEWENRAGTATAQGVSLQPVKIYSNASLVSVYHNGQKAGDVTINSGTGTLNIAFVDGVNQVEARLPEENVADISRVHFTLLPEKLNADFQELNVMLGTRRYFEDKETATVWIPEKAYERGSWGFVGGEAVRPKTRFGSLPA